MGADSSSNWREKQTKKQRSWKMWFQRSSFIRESNFCFLFYICLYSVGLSLYFLLLLPFCIIDDDEECSMSGCRTMSFSTRGNTEFFNGFDRWKFYDAVFRRIAGSVHFGLDKSNRITRTKHSRWAISAFVSRQYPIMISRAIAVITTLNSHRHIWLGWVWFGAGVGSFVRCMLRCTSLATQCLAMAAID